MDEARCCLCLREWPFRGCQVEPQQRRRGRSLPRKLVDICAEQLRMHAPRGLLRLRLISALELFCAGGEEDGLDPVGKPRDPARGVDHHLVLRAWRVTCEGCWGCTCARSRRGQVASVMVGGGRWRYVPDLAPIPRCKSVGSGCTWGPSRVAKNRPWHVCRMRVGSLVWAACNSRSLSASTASSVAVACH